MAQSEQDLYRDIVKEYKAAVKEDSRIEALKKRLESEKTTTAAAWEYGDAAGSDLEKAFLEKAKEIVDSEDGYKAVKKALKAGYDDVSDYTADVLSGQNKKAGIGMKGTPADFEDVRSTASAISNKISNAETVEECENYIREEVKTFTNNAVGDTIRETARMSESQGMSPKIERSASSTACQYCLGLAGSYVYPCDREVFTRHANCDCVVEYQPVKGARKIVSSSTVRQNRNSLNPEERERRAERRKITGNERARIDNYYSNRVQINALDAPGFKEKFNKITNNEETNLKIYEYAVESLKHRDGTNCEDLYLLDANGGGLIYSLTTSTLTNEVRYDETILQKIEEAKRNGIEIISIHNHPGGLPPSLDDGSSAYVHGYTKGVVVGHNLEVYTYTPTFFELSREDCDKVHQELINTIAYDISFEESVWYSVLHDFGMEIQRK